MVKFYTNKDLSGRLKVNLARWKRWSREFLPPDPLGGLQSGYARQYNPDDAFTIYIGGHLVHELKFSIPEAKQILLDLHPWLVDHHFYFDFSDSARAKTPFKHPVKWYHIVIIRHVDANGSYCGNVYLSRGILSVEWEDQDDLRLRTECAIEFVINPYSLKFDLIDVESHRVLNISALRKKFLNCLP
jgi:hypothetical protein